MSEQPLPFGARVALAFVFFFRVLFDGMFAARANAAPGLVAPPAPPPELPPPPEPPPPPAAAPPPSTDAALRLLALLQREGRLVDFLEQDIEPYSDAEIGATARVVHAGCRKAVRDHMTIVPIRAEEEEARVKLSADYDPAEVKLSGNVAGKGPYAGVLRHRGWRASDVALPVPTAGHDASVVFPAEVEIA